MASLRQEEKAMGVRNETVLRVDTTLAGLEALRNDSEVSAFEEAAGTVVVSEGVGLRLTISAGQASPAPGRLLRLPRERLVLETSNRWTRVSMEYPGGVEEVAGIGLTLVRACDATALENATPTAFGFNIEMVYDQDSGETAIQYLGRRLLRTPVGLVEGETRFGGSARIVLPEAESRLSVVIEPRHQSLDTPKVFLAMNQHFEGGRVPSADEMTERMSALWKRASAFATDLDARTT